VSRRPHHVKNTGRPPDPVTVTDVSTRLSYGGAGDFYLFALVREPHEAWLSAAAHTVGRDPGRISRDRTKFAGLGDLTATDDAGRPYALRFGGGGHGGWEHLQLHFAPGLPPDVAWVDVRVRDGAPARVDLAGHSRAEQSAAEHSPADLPPVTFAVRPLALRRAERYVQALAEAALAATDWRSALRALAAATRALLAADAVPAGSPLPGQVAELCSIAGLPSDRLPDPAPLPEHWSSLIGAYPFGDRDPYAGDTLHGPPAVARLAMALPEIDGARVALTALVSRGKMTELYGSFGTNADESGLGSCWVRDDSGQWHAALPGNWTSDGRVTIMTHATLVPPVPPSARSAEVVITGATTQARATVPLAWWAP
jgi:hypothetical protein